MRKKFYLLLVLLSLINSVSCEEKYISLGEHEHGQMEHPLSRIEIHNIVVALSKSASIKVDGPTLLGSKVKKNIIFIFFFFDLGLVQLNIMLFLHRNLIFLFLFPMHIIGFN